jgi:hypothetical protein
MRFEFTSFDSEGKPTHVNTDDGFMMCSRKYNPEADGWMQQQLDPSIFPAIQTGRDMEWLVAEVNRLQREDFGLKQQLAIYTKTAGF